ncbi:sensor histidine kinase [Pseudogracilibacillus sp. SO30301A]|uniref:sensor histidine kinase n=1 Tax=Pseudogracilibacillus sp. SO30301A TaxID=3098291 RepID=UPI00300E3353
MKVMFRIVVYLIMTFVLMFIFTSVVLAAVSILLPEMMEKGVTPLVILGSMYFISLIAYGWYVGKPVYYMIRWIHHLANGDYHPPVQRNEIYSQKTHKLKGSYRVYKELIDHLETLTQTLENNHREREKMDRMRKEWMAGVSHDLKTPLTYITGYSTMLLTSRFQWSEEKQKEFLLEIQGKSEHMNELIQDLNLSFRLEGSNFPLKMENTDVVELVRRTVADVASAPWANGYHLSLETVDSHLNMRMDSILFQRALRNLLVNSVTHNPKGTRIRVTLQKFTDVKITIEDNGKGMDEETVEHLFQKYYRGTSTDAISEGTGLGMAVAQQLISAHNGHIYVNSRVNEGTTMQILMPLPK